MKNPFRRNTTVAKVVAPLNRALKALDRIAEEKIAEATDLNIKIADLFDERDDAEQEAAKAQRLRSKIAELVEE